MRYKEGLSVGFDMDGVLCDFIGTLIPTLQELFGLSLEREDFVGSATYELVYPMLTPDQQRIFEDRDLFYQTVTPPGFFKKLEPYPGMSEALHQVAEEQEYLCIVTRPIEWDRCPGEKKWWIDKYLGDLKLPIFMVSRMEAKSFVQVDVMVDDDPRVLKSLDYSIGLAVEQPWNRKFLELEPFKTVTGIHEVPLALREIKKELFF
jgi:5'(3')-deoxyribonucleotidase